MRVSPHTTSKEAGYVPLPIDVIRLNELRLYGTFGMQGQRFARCSRCARRKRWSPLKWCTKRLLWKVSLAF
jgi:hypothetical protein